MRRRWLLEVDGRRFQLDAEWDMLVTSRGAARIDGVEVARWWPGRKVPGVTATVPVHGRSVCLVGLTGDFDIDLSRSPGVHAIDPPLPPDYAPTARVKRQLAVMWLALALCLALPLMAAGLAVLVWALRTLR
jgi:hypothetical protein